MSPLCIPYGNGFLPPKFVGNGDWGMGNERLPRGMGIEGWEMGNGEWDLGNGDWEMWVGACDLENRE